MEALEKYSTPTSRLEAEFRIIAHEPARCNRERDMGSLNHFHRGKAMRDGNLRAILLEVGRTGNMATAHVFEWAGNKNNESMFLVAPDGHLRWAKPSGRSTGAVWKEWGENMQYVESHPYVEVGDDPRTTAWEPVPTLTPCKHGSSLIKTHLGELAVGVSSHPWLEPEGKLVGANDTPQLNPSMQNVEVAS